MVFSSLLFLFRFLPLILLAYYLAPKRLRNGVLFAGSLIFYGWGEPVYITLLLFSTLVDFIHGQLVERFREAGKLRQARLAVASSVVINLALLCFFKYTDFLFGSLNAAFGTGFPLPGLALPVGISFYTFQTMSYTIDVYRKDARAQRDIVAFGAYVSMFPQLIAGPIVRYHTIAGELSGRKESLDGFVYGIRRFVLGLGKKVLIANQIGAVFAEITGMFPDDRSVLMAWMGIFAFGMQIYFDFSGYSDMAVGLGAMFGFHFPENFRYPYESKSITEFWRRWHISLGTWFKEYVYIPLGGNRRGKLSQVRNILIVWTLTGIWHGAGFNFLLWGLYFGVLLLIEKLFLGNVLSRLPGAAGLLYAQLFVFLGWVLFAFDDLGAGAQFLSQMAGLYRTAGGEALPFVTERTLYLFASNGLLFLAAVLGATRLPAAAAGRIRERLGGEEAPPAGAERECEASEMAAGAGKACEASDTGDAKEGACPACILWPALELSFTMGVLALSTAFLVNAGYNPFLYFRF